MPLVGSFEREAEVAKDATRYPLGWQFCSSCGIAQLDQPVKESDIFDVDNYSFATGTVPALVQHFGELANIVSERYRPRSLLEFGSNDGTFLKFMQSNGVQVVGVDPAANVSAIAQSQGIDVYVDFLSVDVSERIVRRHGQFDFIIGANCFAHNESEHPVLDGVTTLLAADGVLCIEVMYAVDVICNIQWDSLYHEHVFLYSLTSLSNLLGQHGLRIFDAERIPTHAGSIRVFARLSEHVEQTERLNGLLAAERALGLETADTWIAFGKRATTAIQVTRDVVGMLSRHKRVWGYGASGRAAMWANACGLSGIEAIVDASPHRFGRYLCGTGTPVISLEEAASRDAPDIIMIFAWNYRDAIVKQGAFHKGIWAVPLPELSFFSAGQQ
jgi:novobiocin biosynthesis protein NovU/D-mycarose 3-C-methyltransferase